MISYIFEDIDKMDSFYDRDSKCCRCLQNIPKEKELGGTFGGVVCIYHRVCQDCWWGKNKIKGKRKDEPDETRNVPLVNGPRKKIMDSLNPECFGCLYDLPDHVSAQKRWTGNTGSADNVIEISDDE